MAAMACIADDIVLKWTYGSAAGEAAVRDARGKIETAIKIAPGLDPAEVQVRLGRLHIAVLQLAVMRLKAENADLDDQIQRLEAETAAAPPPPSRPALRIVRNKDE